MRVCYNQTKKLFTLLATYTEVHTITPFHVFLTKTTLMMVMYLSEAVLIPFLVNILILFPLKTAEEPRGFFIFSGSITWDIRQIWVNGSELG